VGSLHATRRLHAPIETVRNRRGQRTDQLVGKLPQVTPGKKTRKVAAEKAGFGNDKTYRQAAKVLQKGSAGDLRASSLTQQIPVRPGAQSHN